MNLPKAMIMAAAALAIACGGSDDKTASASADEAQQAYAILLTHLDFAFDQAHENATSLTAADAHEDFNYSGNCTSGGSLDVTGSVDENQGNDGTVAFTYTQNVTFTACSLDGSVIDGPLMQTETFTEQVGAATLTEIFDVQLTSDKVAIKLVDANDATTGSFNCSTTSLDTTTTVTETDSGQGQVPTRTQTVDGSGTLCARPWDNAWGTSYQFSTL